MRSPTGRIWVAVTLIAIGVLAVFLALGPLRFGERLADRVDVTGQIHEGYDLESADGAEISDGEFGAWVVEYEIDGSQHVGFLIGSYTSGTVLEVSAPADGSIYQPLTEATSTAAKILSWPLMLLGLLGVIVGLVLVVIAVRARDRLIRIEMNRRLGLPDAGLAPLGGPVPPRLVAPTWQQATRPPQQGGFHPSTPYPASPYAEPSHPDSRPPAPPAGNPFFEPYDL